MSGKFILEFIDDTHCNYIDYIPDMEVFKRKMASNVLSLFPIVYGNIDDCIKITFVKDEIENETK
jgi:hypothetical protein